LKPLFAQPLRNLQRNVLAGVITIGPLFVTWLVFSFLLGSLAKAGLPAVQFLAAILPEKWIGQPWLQSTLAVVLTLLALYILGSLTSLVIGRQALNLFETLLDRLPFVAKVSTFPCRGKKASASSPAPSPTPRPESNWPRFWCPTPSTPLRPSCRCCRWSAWSIPI
jgi:hypothetical protein